jgi:septal ring factor EnvC (AmiA/AmiB activator)
VNVRLVTVSCVLCLAALASAQGALDVSLASLTSVDAQLREQRTALDEQHAKREALAAQLGTLPERRQALEGTLTRDVRALYRLQRGGLLPIASGLDALMSHASRVAHFERLTRRTLAALVRARREASALHQETSELALQIAATEEQVATLEQAKLSLERAAQVEASIDQDLTGDLGVVPVSAAAATSQPSYGLSFSDGQPAPSARAERFSRQRGELALPVAGSSSVEDVARPDDEGTALRFQTKSGSNVRAAAAGRVSFASQNEAYGLFVIVDHGERFRTVYGGLGSLDVQVGDAISKSARIGTTGAAGVYFEVRRGRHSQDARSWLGL